MALRKKAPKYIAGKGENDGNQHFLLFSQSILPNQGYNSSFEPNFVCRLQIFSTRTSLKFGCFVQD